ncbi:MAG: hypothetical protein CL878_15015 [Dehalococcoidia bacterium]|nr:hypothetical protein [Dehalococcoidia bacterium]
MSADDQAPAAIDAQPPTTDDDGTLSVAAAALHRGVSESTIRRWIKQGRLQVERVQTLQGFVYRIPRTSLDGGQPPTNGRRAPYHNAQAAVETSPPAAPSSPPPVTSTPSDTAGPLQDALALIERLHGENSQLSGQVGFLQAKLQDAEEQIKLLQPPPPEPPEIAADGPDSGEGAEAEQDTTEEPQRRWWRLWRWGR